MKKISEEETEMMEMIESLTEEEVEIIEKAVSEKRSEIDMEIEQLALDRERSRKIRGLAIGTISACALFTILDYMKITTCAPTEPFTRGLLIFVSASINEKYKILNEQAKYRLIDLESLKGGLENFQTSVKTKTRERK